ncbi:iron uptake transporter deferrochelatase/peroxidase subunit [Celerinatantimonas diazotrophica]|uniref:Deferrochelatase n=1 Tax=Celerinatantimonas diazotrophica TaxID=412034 RepID=A0A4R1J9G6_9GAMM|nr:iron uptake transporter deferrochelatase/peroxidase subunit [Celerinatantimonas diazotrophica]TCK47067.1 deferrochelatase/peroxidase EfeB [Celerinatantimonas diazotrophica]CAG9295836.1 Deferrochelatase/peroxidase EfeB [Celerinatantimonas diazotrophica]
MACPFHLGKKKQAKSDIKDTSRRKMLKGMVGVAGGALAYSGLSNLAYGQTNMRNPAMVDFDSANKRQPFYGNEQSGIITPQQANVALVAFDVLATDRTSLKTMFKTLNDRIAFLMHGGTVPQRDAKYPPMDSGIMGPVIEPDNLTITVSVGASLFDQRFGLSHLKPRQLKKMTRFANDALQSEYCHGDILLQICANSPDTTLHALRDIIKHCPGSLAVRWRRDGFISAHAAASAGQQTPINLLGFKDGTVNPPGNDHQVQRQMLWVQPGADEPQWAVGGSYQAVRLIRFYVEHWDRTPLQEQQTIFGRNRDTGAPLGMRHEHDDPDYASDPHGKRIPMDAHMRLANPRTPDFPKYLLLRRGYSYSYTTSASGQLDVGLLFIAYQSDLDKGFIDTQNRLNGEPLEEYIKPFGGGYFFALPGVKSPNHYLGQTLLES